VALPAIGCGKHRCPVDLIVKTMMKEIKNQLKMRNIPLTVRFVIQPEQRNLYEEFSKQVLSIQEGIKQIFL
jgi:O-acetyl-ADP-ribose deacetylase (regulator of RNase III)